MKQLVPNPNLHVDFVVIQKQKALNDLAIAFAKQLKTEQANLLKGTDDLLPKLTGYAEGQKQKRLKKNILKS